MINSIDLIATETVACYDWCACPGHLELDTESPCTSESLMVPISVDAGYRPWVAEGPDQLEVSVLRGRSDSFGIVSIARSHEEIILTPREAFKLVEQLLQSFKLATQPVGDAAGTDDGGPVLRGSTDEAEPDRPVSP
jgi:hypothetical protein